MSLLASGLVLVMGCDKKQPRPNVYPKNQTAKSNEDIKYIPLSDDNVLSEESGIESAKPIKK